MATSPVTLPRQRISGVPVLLYHRVGTEAQARQDKYSVSARALLEHLRFLQRHARVILVKELPRLPPPQEVTCALTFDDGGESDFQHAFPLLLETGLPATFFINTAHAGKRGYLSWAQMREMQRAGMSFQSHGHQHVNFARLPRATAVSELQLSRGLLEQKLGCAVDCFAAPYGLVNRRLISAAREAGFKLICTSHNWPAKPGRQIAGRIAVHAGAGLPEFQKLVWAAAAPLLRRSLREAALWAPKLVAQWIWPQRFRVPVPEDAA